MAVNMLHPTRVLILEAMARGQRRSPTELAEEIGVSLGSVAYHVRTLLDAGALELVSETRVRGAVEHHYTIAQPQRERLRDQMEATRALALRAKRALAA